MKAFFNRVIRYIKRWNYIRKDTARLSKLDNKTPHRIFYFGICKHSNLGDMAQYFCILNWIKENYPNHQLIQFEADTIVDKRFSFLPKFKKIYHPDNIIIFQSGYTTQDLGGFHEEMHRLIIETVPNAKILMMPQTIYFQHSQNKQRCAENHNKARNMLFLARDFVSFEMAKQMFPAISVKAFPDIVTTLIGNYHFQNQRNGVYFCLRNDEEKFYNSADLLALTEKIKQNDPISISDTTLSESFLTIRQNLQQFVEKEIEKFSHFKITITDRYHGTIFSLAASTPVIILKTTDHKVVTGADWFKGIYDDYVHVAQDLDDAFNIYQKLSKSQLSHSLSPYFKANFYDNLKSYFENQ